MRQAYDTIIGGTTGHQHKTFCEKRSRTSDDAVQLSGVLPEARFFGASDVAFKGCITNLEDAPESTWTDQLVVYRMGDMDPMRVIAEAMARGAAGILTEQLLPCPLPQCIVADVPTATARIDAAILDRPDRKLLTVGIVGTAGKTTTSLLVSAVLRKAGVRTAYQNDLGQCDGVVQATPDSAPPVNGEIVRWLSEAVDADSQAAVIELSDVELRRGHYDAIEFDVLVMTGATEPTGDFGPAALECALEQLTRDGVVIAPADDPVGMRTILDAGVRAVTYGMRQNADVTAKVIDQSGGMTTLLVSHEDTTLAMETSLCGSAMAANQLAAVALGLLIDYPLHVVIEAITAIRSLPGRVQTIPQMVAADVILDIAHTPIQVVSALRAARSMRGTGKLWCVLAMDVDNGDDELALFGNALERFADQGIITATANAKSAFLMRSHEVLDGVQDCAAFRLVADQTRAIQWAMSEARSYDTVLVLTGNNGNNPRAQREAIEQFESLVNEASQDHADRPAFRVVRAD